MDKLAISIGFGDGNVGEARHPLDLFPEEVWLDILKWLDNPVDLLRTGESSNFLELLLENGSPKILGAGKTVCQLVTTLPLLLKYLGKADILNLRGVCKRVHFTVDQVLEENSRVNPSLNLFPWLLLPPALEQSRGLSFEYRDIKLPTEVSPAVIMNSEKKIEHLTTALEEQKLERNRNGRNLKLIGGRINIEWGLTRRPKEVQIFLGERDVNEDDVLKPDLKEYPTPRFPQRMHGPVEDEDGLPRHAPLNLRITRQRAFLKKCIQFFTQFPDEIRFLRISLGMAADSYTKTYKFLQRLISLLPNLRRLDVQIRSTHRHRGRMRDVEELAETINLYPLPPSPNLESISISYYIWPEPFLREIANRYGGQLKELALATTESIMELVENVDPLYELVVFPVSQESYQFPVLERLSLNAMSPSRAILLFMKTPSLKYLESKTTLEQYARLAGVRPVIELITRYPLLEDLKVDLAGIEVARVSVALEELERRNVQQKCLKRLTIMNGEDSNILLCFFTRLCPNLESIVFEDDEENGHRTANVDLQMMRARCMKRSGIWEEAGNLQRIKYVKMAAANTVLVYECTRP